MTAPLRPKLLWLLAARVVVVTLLLGSAILVQIRAPGTQIDPFFFLIALTYGLTAIYGALLRYTEQRPWLVDLQLAGDALIVSMLVCLSGGILSYFTSLYTLPIIAASTVRSRRGGMTVALVSALAYAALVGTQYADWWPASLAPATLGLPPGRIALFSVGLSVFGFLAVAALSGYLAEGLRKADARLQQASNQLADLQAFSQHVIDSLGSGLATTDLAGQILTFNRAAEGITGMSADQVVGHPIGQTMRWPEAIESVFASQNAGTGAGDRSRQLPRVEFELVRPDGRKIDVGLSTAVLRTPRGDIGFVFTFRDVTDARREEREARLQQRLAAVGEMAAGIAHEIRNPLASMSGSIQILRQELPLTGEQSLLMDIVIRESERLNDTIRSFLAYARPQRQAVSRVDVRLLVTDTATLLQNSPERLASHVFRVHVPAEPVCCIADEAQIRQVIWNLASNGLRAMPAGGVLRMSVAAHPDAGEHGYLSIAVQDDGVGIAEADLDAILHPFRGGFVGGAGLGLSIVHRIVSDYGGEVQVASQVQIGTTVTVKLPLAAGTLVGAGQQAGT